MIHTGTRFVQRVIATVNFKVLNYVAIINLCKSLAQQRAWGSVVVKALRY